jgi:uncharacterized protein YqeY
LPVFAAWPGGFRCGAKGGSIPTSLFRMGQLKNSLRRDLTAAMREQDKFTMQVLRMALSALGAETVAGDTARDLSDPEELAVVTREVRQRRDSAEVYAAAGRSELAEKEAAEADFLARYLPAALTESELDALVAEEVARVPGATLKQMGALVRAVNARVQGRAEGKVVAAKVKAALSS